MTPGEAKEYMQMYETWLKFNIRDDESGAIGKTRLAITTMINHVNELEMENAKLKIVKATKGQGKDDN